MKNKITINKLMWTCGVFIFTFCSFFFMLANLYFNSGISDAAYNIKYALVVLLIISNILSGAALLGKLLIYIEQKK